MFRDCKQGDNLYIYDRIAIGLSTESVMSVGVPKLDKTNVANGMVVDITAGQTTYTFKDTSNIGYAGNLIISSDKATILREVESQKAANESQIARVDTLKAELPKLDAVIDLLSPERKEKKIQEERMASMAEEIKSLKEMVELLVNAK